MTRKRMTRRDILPGTTLGLMMKLIQEMKTNNIQGQYTCTHDDQWLCWFSLIPPGTWMVHVSSSRESRSHKQSSCRRWASLHSSPSWASSSQHDAADSSQQSQTQPRDQTMLSCRSWSVCHRNLKIFLSKLFPSLSQFLQLPTWKVQTWLSKGYIVKSIWQEISRVTLKRK